MKFSRLILSLIVVLLVATLAVAIPTEKDLRTNAGHTNGTVINKTIDIAENSHANTIMASDARFRGDNRSPIVEMNKTTSVDHSAKSREGLDNNSVIHVWIPSAGKSWDYKQTHDGHPVGTPVGKPAWNSGWVYEYKTNGGWWNGQTTSALWQNWNDYENWPNTMDSRWYLNWDYAPDSGVYVLGAFNNGSNVDIVLFNPTSSGKQIGGWRFLVDGTAYAFDQNAWIKTLSTATIQVPAAKYMIQIVDGDQYLAQFPWRSNSVMLGNNGRIYYTTTSVQTFSSSNGLYVGLV